MRTESRRSLLFQMEDNQNKSSLLSVEKGYLVVLAPIVSTCTMKPISQEIASWIKRIGVLVSEVGSLFFLFSFFIFSGKQDQNRLIKNSWKSPRSLPGNMRTAHQANPHVHKDHIVGTMPFRSGLPQLSSSQMVISLDKGWPRGNPDQNAVVPTI